jgi:hypothetical protein
MEGPTQFTAAILAQLMAWVSNEQSPLIPEAAPNQDLSIALHLQAHIGWGWFFKGFCTTGFQKAAHGKTMAHRVRLNKLGIPAK